jgi:DNA helicase-2/ATP-dependent DNA helicase PcrA
VNSQKLLDGLNEDQLRAVTTEAGPVVVLAGAGSGKTRVLTRRIAWRVLEGQTDPNRVMALTFTRSAAAELRHRLLSLGLRDRVTAGTFHAMALFQLRTRWAERNLTPPKLVDRKLRLISQLLPRSGGGRPVDAIDVASEIDWARARLVDPTHYPLAAAEAGRTPPLPAEQIGELMTAYQQLKRRRRVVDFDDLLLLAIRDLQADQAYAEAVRWRFRHLYVDEFQDVNPLQYELLAHWRGTRPDLFVVGDPNQAIYGWNGADAKLLDRFVQRERSGEVIQLVQNYRSTPQVLALASSLVTTPPLEANRADGPVPTITAYVDDRAEAAGIAVRARAAHSVAGSWSDQAVLVRTNAQLLVIEQALRNAGVPVRLRAGAGPLATAEVQAELRSLTADGADLAACAEALDDRLDRGPATDPRFEGGPAPALPVAEIERRANIGALVTTLHEYLAVDPAPNGPGFAAWIATLQNGDVSADHDGVELATFHGAKGLEWPVVHVAGLEEGFVPIAYATTGAQTSEERRLLYVALTRAIDELHLSWAMKREFGAKSVNRQPSPHLVTLAAATDRLGVGPAHRVDWRAQLARSRQRLALAPAPEPTARATSHPRIGVVDPTDHDAVYRALHQWRLRRARAADVPPHVVFSDHTLRVIARERPTSRTRLASVPGMGPAKLSRYGDDLLRLLAEVGPRP